MSERPDQEPSPFTRPSFILASVFIGAAILGGSYLGISAWMSPTPPKPDGASAPVSQVSPAPQTESGAGCPTAGTALSTAGDLLPPAEELVIREGLSVPAIEGVGPLVTGEELPRCWTQSPQGALLAGVNVIKQLFVQENAVAVLTAYVEDTPVRQKLLDTQAQAQLQTTPQMLVLGYKYTHVEDNFVSADIALGAHWISDAPISVSVDMVWNERSQDWKLVLNDDGWNMKDLPIDIMSAGFREWRA